MKKNAHSYLWLVMPLIMIMLVSWESYADILYLKNGEKLEGDIIGRAYDYIVVRIPVFDREAIAESKASASDKKVYFYEIDKIQYDSGITEIVSKMSKVKVEEATADESLLSAEYDETAKLVSFKLTKGSLIKPFVKVMAQNTAGIKITFSPDINIENKDGVVTDHMQKRDIILEQGLEVSYIGLGPSGVEYTPLIYKVENIEIDSEKTAMITLCLGEAVSNWQLSSDD